IKFSISKWSSSFKVMVKVLAENVRIASTPKFKRHRLSAVRDFPPGCGRVTAPSSRSSELITIDRSSQGKC
ncbi:hypothetical protein J1N35_041276, partial [Gossypium stocksii]